MMEFAVALLTLMGALVGAASLVLIFGSTIVVIIVEFRAWRKDVNSHRREREYNAAVLEAHHRATEDPRFSLLRKKEEEAKDDHLMDQIEEYRRDFE